MAKITNNQIDMHDLLVKAQVFDNICTIINCIDAYSRFDEALNAIVHEVDCYQKENERRKNSN